MPEDLGQQKLEAEILNLRSQTAKTEAERSNLRKSWRDWVVETIKVGGAIVLGAGGITAAISGYQLSEVKKERMDLAIEKAEKQLAELTEAKKNTLDQLALINTQLDELKGKLEAVRKSNTPNSALLEEAIDSAVNIKHAVAQTNAQLRAVSQTAATSHALSDYLVGLQTLGIDDATRNQLNQKIQEAGYGLHELSAAYPANDRPAWFAKKSTVLYYADSAVRTAQQVAALMKQLTGIEFAVQRGSGLGVDPSQQDVTLFVHYVKR